MIRRLTLERIALPVVIAVPVLFTIATFYKTRDVTDVEPAIAEAFAALLWLSLAHVPLYFAPRALQRSRVSRAGMAGLLLLPTAIMFATVRTGVALAASWITFDDAAAWCAQYVLALVSLIAHGISLAALLRPDQLLQRTAPAV